jgi:L-fucose dehydrogenase
MDLNLNGKVVLIAGADELGAAIAQALVAEGALPASHEGYEPAIQDARRRFGRIDALVNIACPADEVSLEHGSTEKFVASVDQSLLRLYSNTRSVVSHLKNSRGCIVNIAPRASQRHHVDVSRLSGVRGAILALTREWAAELIAAGVRVNAIIPQDQQPATVDKIAALVVFLVSSRAAHITGQHLFVAGTDMARGNSTAETRKSQ